MIARAIVTAVLLALWGFSDTFLRTMSTPWTAELAGKQFDNSNASYAVSTMGMQWVSDLHAPVILLLVILALIWGPFLYRRYA